MRARTPLLATLSLTLSRLYCIVARPTSRRTSALPRARRRSSSVMPRQSSGASGTAMGRLSVVLLVSLLIVFGFKEQLAHKTRHRVHDELFLEGKHHQQQYQQDAGSNQVGTP